MFGDKTVDLSSRFPKIVSGRERALRLAKDPVAAADFFEFCVKSLFHFLLGWDYSTHSSTKEGGILGKLQAFYGVNEFTGRGSIHGHFLLWLLGGLNPADLHTRLTGDSEYQKQFFDYFETIIHHHLPDIEVEISNDYNPCVECPPVPPTLSQHPTLDVLNEWESVYATEVKKCYNGLFVGQFVINIAMKENLVFFFHMASYFDPEINPIVLLCCDSSS